MKRNIFKDRKTLTLFLCLILVCVFTLTVAYSALNAVLTIQGNARVSAADWDIHLNNPRVSVGSSTMVVPVIKTSSTLEFETTLNMPGDYYEFVVDVVNAGDIDAMIENVVKTPDLTTEQAKFLKYEVSYQNGESITTKQLLAKDTTMPIKVRIEYRKDLSNSDLPTGQVVLDLALTLEYIQSDGSGSNVTNNGVDPYAIGNEKCIGSECFYIMSSDSSTLTMLAKYNLHVGNICTSSSSCTAIENSSGIQDETVKGWVKGYNASNPMIGTMPFSSTKYWTGSGLTYPAYIYNENSNLYGYVENYKSYLEGLGVKVNDARLISAEELESLGCSSSNRCNNAPDWVYSSSYWTGTAKTGYNIWCVGSNGYFGADDNTDKSYGVRPVIVVSKDYF